MVPCLCGSMSRLKREGETNPPYEEGGTRSPHESASAPPTRDEALAHHKGVQCAIWSQLSQLARGPNNLPIPHRALDPGVGFHVRRRHRPPAAQSHASTCTCRHADGARNLQDGSQNTEVDHVHNGQLCSRKVVVQVNSPVNFLEIPLEHSCNRFEAVS